MENIISTVATFLGLLGGVEFLKFLWNRHSIKKRGNAEAASAEANANSLVLENYNSLFEQMREFHEDKDNAHREEITEVRKQVDNLELKVKEFADKFMKQDKEIDSLKRRIKFKNYVIYQAHYCKAPTLLDGHTCIVIDAIQNRNENKLKEDDYDKTR